MKKAVGRGATGKKKSLKTAEPKKTAGKRSSPKPAQRRTFDPDALLNSMGGMVFVASPEYRIEYMNEAALRKMGRDMTGRHCFKVFHGLEERCPWCMGELVLKGETIKQEILNRIDNRWYSSINTPLYREDGSVSIQALVFDITDQKQAQAALVQNEALLRSIHQAAPMGIGVVTSRVLDWTNEPLCRMTGYTAEELRGKSARIFYADDEEFDRVGRHKYAEIRSKGTGSIVTVWRRKDGRPISVYLSSTPIDPGDLSAGVVFTALDVTEKKKAQDELWRSEEKYRPSSKTPSWASSRARRRAGSSPSTPQRQRCAATVPPRKWSPPSPTSPPSITSIPRRGISSSGQSSSRASSGISSTGPSARTEASSGSPSTHGSSGTGGGRSRTTRGPTRTSSGARRPRRPCVPAKSASQGLPVEPHPHAIATIDEGRFIDVNERSIEMSGYTREEMIGRTSIEVGLWACPQERDRLIAILRKTGSLRDGMAHFRTRAGDVKPALWSADAIQLGEKKVLLTTIHDITALAEAQEMLKQSEEKYRLLAENVTDVIWTADLNLKITYVSPSSERVFGWSPSEWLSLRLQDVLTPGSLEQAMGALQHERERLLLPNADEALVTTVELEMYRKDGATGWFEVSSRPLRYEDGKPTSFIGVTRDITQRKKAEEALRKNEALLKSILEAAPIGIGVVHNRVFSWVNEEILAMTGYALDELAGKSARILYADDEEYMRVGREKYEQISTRGREP